MSPDLYIGLMSGTSIDSIDAALVDLSSTTATLQASHSEAIAQSLRQQIIDLCSPGANEIERMGVLDRQLGLLFARAVQNLLAGAGIDHSAITAIGSHGQTIRHRPADQKRGQANAFSCQIGDPNTIAECSKITTVADFRRRDIAAGGQGAPLVPQFHRAAFAKAGAKRAIINIGGMSNISLLTDDCSVSGFDTGPGNVLLDSWIGLHRGESYDSQGAWASSGKVVQAVLTAMLAHPFFALEPPKSTGREDFNLDWLQQLLAALPQQDPADIQACLLELTACSIAQAVDNSDIAVDEVFICGGGAYNTHLMERLAKLLQPRRLASTQYLGIEPEWVEASAFAWLAKQCLQQRPGNDAVVTGATGPRILGGIYHR
jgi:anhydro-N-acetylmuramic acid kinase